MKEDTILILAMLFLVLSYLATNMWIGLANAIVSFVLAVGYLAILIARRRKG